MRSYLLQLGFRIAALLSLFMLILTSTSLRAQPALPAATKLYLPLVIDNTPNVVIRNDRTSRHYWNSRFTSYQTVGEVANLSDQPIYNVKVTLRVYNSDTQVLVQSYEELALLPMTAAGGVNPFKIQWSSSPQGSFDMRTELSVVWDTSASQPTQALSVRSKQIQTVADTVQVIGELEGAAIQPADLVTVAVTIYNANGSLLDAGAQQSRLAAIGSTASYSVTFYKAYSDLTGITPSQIQVQAQRQPTAQP